MMDLCYLTLMGLLPLYHTTATPPHCGTPLMPAMSCEQSVRLTLPDLRHGFLTEYGATNPAVPELHYNVTASQQVSDIVPMQRHRLASPRAHRHHRFDGGEYHWRDHFSSLDRDANCHPSILILWLVLRMLRPWLAFQDYACMVIDGDHPSATRR